MSKHLPAPHIPKRRGQSRWERRVDAVFESRFVQRTAGHPRAQAALGHFLDRPLVQKALGHPKAQRVFLGPEIVPTLWGSLILIGALGIAGLLGEIRMTL